MITEDYVSFETAKLLKEKGFDWDWSPFYCEQDRDEWRQNNHYTTPNPIYDPNLPFDTETLTAIAPHVSIQMAMKWLREVHKIAIILHYDREKFGWWSSVLPMDLDCDDELDQMTLSFDCFEKDYEQVCEAAIKYCLEKLI